VYERRGGPPLARRAGVHVSSMDISRIKFPDQTASPSLSTAAENANSQGERRDGKSPYNEYGHSLTLTKSKVPVNEEDGKLRHRMGKSHRPPLPIPIRFPNLMLKPSISRDDDLRKPCEDPKLKQTKIWEQANCPKSWALYLVRLYYRQEIPGNLHWKRPPWKTSLLAHDNVLFLSSAPYIRSTTTCILDLSICPQRLYMDVFHTLPSSIWTLKTRSMKILLRGLIPTALRIAFPGTEKCPYHL